MRAMMRSEQVRVTSKGRLQTHLDVRHGLEKKSVRYNAMFGVCRVESLLFLCLLPRCILQRHTRHTFRSEIAPANTPHTNSCTQEVEG